MPHLLGFIGNMQRYVEKKESKTKDIEIKKMFLKKKSKEKKCLKILRNKNIAVQQPI